MLPLSEAQKQDLQRRLAAYEADPKAGSSWEEVKARLSGGS
jgi:putative addiction module component (TIGR02574 family)